MLESENIFEKFVWKHCKWTS